MCGSLTSTWIKLPLYLLYHIDYKTFFYSDMEMKPTNAYKHLEVSYVIYILSLLHVHVSATLVAILREVSYKVSSKIYVLFYILIHVHVGGGLEGPGIESWWGQDYPHLSRLALGPTLPPIKWVSGLSRR
jgi:hypothetical protein